MTKTIAWHAEKDSVYHDNNQCHQAAEIPATKRRLGTADLPHCTHCEKLDGEKK